MDQATKELLTDERAELLDRKGRLDAFMVSDEFDELGTENRFLISLQEQIMRQYACILERRIALAHAGKR